jgi:HAD hydrolase, family IA, variant 3
MSSKKFAVLFDLDGVLIDSEGDYSRFWKHIDEIYPTGVENFAIAIKGTTLPEILKYFKDDEVKADIIRRIGEYQNEMHYTLFDGAEDFLAELNRRGIPAAVVTSSDEGKMKHLFSQHPKFRTYFTTIIDASMVTRSKPDPQGYLLGAEKLGVSPADCFVFEDSLQGLKAGRAAGAHVIGVATTYPRETVEQFADEVIDGLKYFTVDKMLALAEK